MRVSALAGSQSSSSLASPRCRRMLVSLSLVDRDQRLGDAVEKAVGADEADARMRLGLRDQMLGAAEADLEPHVVDACGNSARRSAGAGFAEIERELSAAASSNSAACRGLQRMALAPAEEGALRSLGCSSSSPSCRAIRMPTSLAGSTCQQQSRNARLKAGHSSSIQYVVIGDDAAYFTALLICAARSVFSQEKPPSLSGARPKWP